LEKLFFNFFLSSDFLRSTLLIEEFQIFVVVYSNIRTYLNYLNHSNFPAAPKFHHGSQGCHEFADKGSLGNGTSYGNQHAHRFAVEPSLDLPLACHGNVLHLAIPLESNVLQVAIEMAERPFSENCDSWSVLE
jgi:hypothetical protein